MKATQIILLNSLLVLSIMSGFTSKNKLSIEGSWSIVEVQTVKVDGTSTSTFPKESVAIFSNGAYSFCWTSHIATTRSWQMQDNEKLSRFNQSVINAGNFEFKDSILTTKAAFAINPMFVDGVAKFKCYFRGDTLFLRGLSVLSSDSISHPVYASGSYFINKLLRVRK